MKNKYLAKATTLLLLLVFMFCFYGCNNKSSTYPSLSVEPLDNEYMFSFSPSESGAICISENSVDTVLSVIEEQQADYEYSYLYQLDEVFNRLNFDASVSEHQYSVLDEAGNLTSAQLSELVLKNNEKYLDNESFGYKRVEEEYISNLCDFIVIYIKEMRDKYPEVDWQRVYCNLGNLKILYNTGTLNYAQVSEDLVLSLSKGNTEIVLSMKGEDAFSRVLLHEIMHIIQLGCQCEKIENCKRRAGLAVYWEDFSLNTTDWTWLVEGSAERMMCKLTGKEAISYKYKMDYLCSYTMSLLLRDDVQADTMEILCFFDDTDLLFGAFGCESQAQREEIVNLMITTNILQMQPSAFYDAYKAATGIDIKESEDTLNEFSYSLKPSICVTLAKEFYENLVVFLSENQVSANDLFFVINLFEGHLNQHLKYKDDSKAVVNQPFITSYCLMREALFDALALDNPKINFYEAYNNYSILTESDKLNAELKHLPVDKRCFLQERAQWLYELRGLGVKVPDDTLQ